MCDKLDIVFLEILKKHVPLKEKLLTTNQAYSALKKGKKWGKCKKNRNRFLNNLNVSFVTDNKFFSKKIRPFFSNKNNHGTNFKLDEGDKILNDNEKIAEELNFFPECSL